MAIDECYQCDRQFRRLQCQMVGQVLMASNLELKFHPHANFHHVRVTLSQKFP